MKRYEGEDAQGPRVCGRQAEKEDVVQGGWWVDKDGLKFGEKTKKHSQHKNLQENSIGFGNHFSLALAPHSEPSNT